MRTPRGRRSWPREKLLGFPRKHAFRFTRPRLAPNGRAVSFLVLDTDSK
jgi:hypothetical protein